MADLQTWINGKLSDFAKTQPDWEQETVDELTSYLTLLVESTKHEAALRKECQEFLEELLGSATHSFIDELCRRIREDAASKGGSKRSREEEARSVPSAERETLGEIFDQRTDFDHCLRSVIRNGQSRQPGSRDGPQASRRDRSRSPVQRTAAGIHHQNKVLRRVNAGQSSSLHPQDGVQALTVRGSTVLKVPKTTAALQPLILAGDASHPGGNLLEALPRMSRNEYNGEHESPVLTQQNNSYGFGSDTTTFNATPSFFQSTPQFGGASEPAILMPCPNYTIFGFCLSPNCAFQHDGGLQMPLLPTPVGATPQFIEKTQRNQVRGDHRGNCSIMVLNIPPENLDEAHVRQHFSKYGTISTVEFPGQNISIVTFSSNEAAYRAKVSPDPIFNNRFVTTRWYKGRLPEPTSFNGQRNSYGDYGAPDWQSTISEEGLRKLADARIQAAEHRNHLTDLEFRKTSVEQELMEHETALRQLRKQLKVKTRESRSDEDMQSSSEDDEADEAEKAALARKKLILQAELASIEATQKRHLQQQQEGSFMQLQPVHRIDNRPRRLRIYIEQEDEDEYMTARSLQRILMSQTVAPESVVSDEEIYVSTAQIQPDHEVIELGYEHHWQARRLMEQVVDQLGDKVTVSWIDDNSNTMKGSVMPKSRLTGGVAESSLKRKKPAQLDEIVDDSDTDLDVAEEEDWMYD